MFLVVLQWLYLAFKCHVSLWKTQTTHHKITQLSQHYSLINVVCLFIAPEVWAASNNFVESHSYKTRPRRVNLTVHREHWKLVDLTLNRRRIGSASLSDLSYYKMQKRKQFNDASKLRCTGSSASLKDISIFLLKIHVTILVFSSFSFFLTSLLEYHCFTMVC